jgi:anti-sigma factor RsiW
MRCEEVQLALWPAPGPRPATQEFATAFAHYQHCPGCQEFFAAQQALGERLRRLPATRAPAALRDRVQQTIAQDVADRQASRRRARLLGGGGLLVAAAAVLILMLSTPEFPETVAQPLIVEASLALSSQPDSDALTTSDARALRQWFIGRVHYPIDIPQIDDARLLGGRVADLGGTPTAAVFYTYHGRPVTYFPLPSGEVLGNEVDWHTIVARSADGFELALWQEHGLARALVAEMPRADVMRFAEKCRAKALRSS